MKFLRAGEVSTLVGYSVSHIWRMARDGSFPKPVKLGPNATAWLSGEVLEWQQVRVDARDGQPQ